MTISTSALSKFSTSCRAAGRAAGSGGISVPPLGGAGGGTPASGGAGAAAVSGPSAGEEVAGADGAGRGGGVGRIAAGGVGAGSVVTSTRGRPDSPGGPAAVGAPGGAAAEAQPAASAGTRSQHAVRLQVFIAGRSARSARATLPSRWGRRVSGLPAPRG